ncbi:hypothetical protein [Enterococcus massiliensis]|uniref:hypothetical protein n=1 Tax=Enterococcus massiliensis TaxID=1640685 RepID=UPI00065E46CC|nr:hypothetical protein [Enterococcus massiliensis]
MSDSFSTVALIMTVVVLAVTFAFIGNYNLGLALLIIGFMAAICIAYTIGFFAHKNDVRRR